MKTVKEVSELTGIGIRTLQMCIRDRYTGVTSVSGDKSNLGFVLMNQRTMETRYYACDGAQERSAMASAEGQVQNLSLIHI